MGKIVAVYSYGLLAAVILWVYSYKQCLKHGGITAQMDHDKLGSDKHKFDYMYCCIAALQILTIIIKYYHAICSAVVKVKLRTRN